MTDQTPTDALPTPSPLPGSTDARSRPWRAVVVAVLAATLGIGGAALASDAMLDDGPEVVTPTATARPIPVLASGPPGSALSGAVALYAVNAWSSDTRGLVLGAWGAAFSQLLGAGGEGAPPGVEGAALVDDPRLTDPAGGPGFTDPCAGPDPGSEVAADCPTDGIPGDVLGPEAIPANAAAVVAFPHPDVALAGECGFVDVAEDELPIAVITANPGSVELRIGDDEVVIQSDEAEIAEWEDWQDDPAGPRPPQSFVAHCIAVPQPTSTGPLPILVVAVDDAGQVALAETLVTTIADDLPPATVSPLDATMVRVDVPLPAEDAEAEVLAVPVAAFGAEAPTCDDLPPPAGTASGWRIGTDATATAPAIDGDRPYLDAAPRIQRLTVPLPEGEPSLLCISRTTAGGSERTGLLLTPPDARRLRLGVTEVDLRVPAAAGEVEVRGTFAELAWTPCGVELPAAPAGVTDPGVAGQLCSSAGDTGAIAGAGGVLDVSVRVGDGAVHVVRIALSALPGGAAVDRYRIPIPVADLSGELCTAGVVQDACLPPEGENVLGSLEVTAAWDEGPIGPAAWTVGPA